MRLCISGLWLSFLWFSILIDHWCRYRLFLLSIFQKLNLISLTLLIFHFLLRYFFNIFYILFNTFRWVQSFLFTLNISLNMNINRFFIGPDCNQLISRIQSLVSMNISLSMFLNRFFIDLTIKTIFEIVITLKYLG